MDVISYKELQEEISTYFTSQIVGINIGDDYHKNECISEFYSSMLILIAKNTDDDFYIIFDEILPKINRFYPKNYQIIKKIITNTLTLSDTYETYELSSRLLKVAKKLELYNYDF